MTRPSRCLARLCRPKDSGIADYAGLFAVTAGLGVRRRKSSTTLDDYSAIMFKSLADRLAKPLPNACTTACAPTCGATQRASS